MCNIFSGHIISDKSHKDWGKIIFLSGTHHEEDREIIYKEYGQIKLVAWESVKEFSLAAGFKITHSEGDLTEIEKKELLLLIEDWAKNKDAELLVKQKFITAKDNDYSFSLACKSMLDTRDGAVLIAPELHGFKQEAGSNSTQTAGDNSTQKARSNSTQTARSNSTQKAGYNSTQEAGYNSTQEAGYNSTQTAGNNSTQEAGSDSTQTARYISTQKAGSDSTQKAGSNSTQTAGYNSTQTAGDNSTQTAGYNSTQEAGSNSTQEAWYNSTQKAGYNSTQKAGYNSTQEAGYNSTQIQWWFNDAGKYCVACRIVTEKEAGKKYRTNKGVWKEVTEGVK